MMADELVHDYDAVKRREYYLKNRKLKGRKPALVKTTTARRKAAYKPPTKTRAQRQEERRRQIEAKITALKGRLEKLQEVLAAETKKAQARSGVTPAKAKDDKKSSGSSNTPAKKLTAAQKSKKAADEKKAREKDPDQSLADQVKSLTERIKTIQERIAKMRKENSAGAKKPAKK
jgi:chromosome segregation ATPase